MVSPLGAWIRLQTSHSEHRAVNVIASCLIWLRLSRIWQELLNKTKTEFMFEVSRRCLGFQMYTEGLNAWQCRI